MEEIENKIKCILLVDDDLATNFINKRIIQKANISEHIQVALNGKEAIDYLCKKGEFETSTNEFPQPQLILLDINMPVMDGWEFMEAYKNLDIPNKEEIAIVMLSSSFNPADKTKSESIEEISDFRQKPMGKEDLIDIIVKTSPHFLEQAVF